MIDIEKIKKETYELTQYAEMILEDLSQKIDKERKEEEEKRSALMEDIKNKDLELSEKEQVVVLKNKEIQSLNKKLSNIVTTVESLQKICEEVQMWKIIYQLKKQ